MVYRTQPKPEPAPKGRGVTVQGTVTKVDVKDTDFGIRRVMTVEGFHGWRVWGTVPTSILTVEKGQRIEFVANITHSDDDPGFGFFDRPRKARIMEDHERFRDEPRFCADCSRELSEDVLYSTKCPECAGLPF